MRASVLIGTTALVLLTLAMLVGAGWDIPPVESVQRGYRGVAIEQVYNPRVEAEKAAAVQIPEEPWPLELPAPDEERARDIYENVQVLGDLGSDQFSRLMQAMTNWVSPEQGCAYCHNEENYAEDSVYTKIVSRRMLQMTQFINADYKSHVANVGVTCYTCHRGKNVPEYIWFQQPSKQPDGMLGDLAGQNGPSGAADLASLPNDPFSPFFLADYPIRVQDKQALPGTNRKSIKQTEWTYSLMIHFSKSLGVNCTYCHNSRAFGSWEQSSPQRVTAWHGIDMVRNLNQDYLEPLGPQYPQYRLGVVNDAPKLNCTTCHQGVYKPLYGVNMVKDYPSLQTIPGVEAASDAPAKNPAKNMAQQAVAD